MKKYSYTFEGIAELVSKSKTLIPEYNALLHSIKSIVEASGKSQDEISDAIDMPISTFKNKLRSPMSWKPQEVEVLMKYLWTVKIG